MGVVPDGINRFFGTGNESTLLTTGIEELEKQKTEQTRYPVKRLRLKNPIVLMPMINMAGAVSTFVYFYFILPPVTEEKPLPWEYSVLFFAGASLVLFLFFVLESVWRESLPLFFPDGKLNQISHVFRISVQKRFLLGVLGIAFIPLPVLATTISSAIHQIHVADAVIRTRIMNSLFWELLFISLDSIAIACILAYLLAKAVSVPLEQIRTAIQSVEKSNLETRVPILSNDELGEVAEGMNRMIESLRESRRAEEAFGRYMGNEIRDAILSGDVSLEGEMKRATLLFCDLRNFTGMVETTHPREVVQILNQYFSEMTRAITDHQGLVLQYVGDEIEAVFGTPVAMDDHPEKAVQAALSMRAGLEALNRTLLEQGYAPLAHGIGIHSGAVLAGNIGSPEKMSYALVGDTVNTASRLEGLTKDYEVDIIMSQTTYNLLTGNYSTEQLPPVKIKGKKEGLMIYRLIS